MLEHVGQIGNHVIVRGQMIPALYIEYKEWGITFEVHFNDSRSWTVKQGTDHLDPGDVMVTEFRWMENSKPIQGMTVIIHDWDEFLVIFNEKSQNSRG